MEMTVMAESRYCSLCGCFCVACQQLGGCDDCELLHPELLDEDIEPLPAAEQ